MFKTIRERIPFQAQYATKRIVPATQTARTAATAGNPRKVDLVGSAETLKNVMKGKCEARKTAVICQALVPLAPQVNVSPAEIYQCQMLLIIQVHEQNQR